MNSFWAGDIFKIDFISLSHRVRKKGFISFLLDKKKEKNISDSLFSLEMFLVKSEVEKIMFICVSVEEN